MQPEQQFSPDVPLSIVRPLSVTIIAILAIIGGSLTLLMLPVNIAQLIGAWPQPPPTRQLYADPTFHLVLLVGTVFNALVAPLWLVSGIGLLRLRPWARRTFIFLCVLAIVSQIIFPIVTWSAFQSFFDSQINSSPQAQVLHGIMTGSMVVGALLALSVSTTFLVLITRPKATAAFRHFAS